MKQAVKLGGADFSVLVFIPDPASTDGSGKTGLAAANLTVSYTRMETDNDVTVTDVTSSLNDLAALTTAHTDWGVKEVSSTLAPGLYRLDLADAVLASGIWSAVVYVMITTSAAAASPMEFIAVAYDPLDAVRLGLTGLANATPGAAGGLVIAGSNAATTFAGITSSAGIVVTQSAADTAGVAITGNGTASGLKITGGATGAGLDLNGGGTSGSAMTLQTTSGSGIVIVPTAGHGISIVADGTSKHGITVTGGTAGTSDGIKAVAGSGGVDIRGAITGSITGSVSGAVGSVTGAVGSVTGNVGGNVVGTVASVVGAVGSVTGAVGSVGAGGIAASTFAAGAIDATAIATNAVDADALAADAVTEIWAKAMTELTGPPAANGTVLQALTFLLMALRNLRTTTATADTIANDAGATIATATLSDDATTFTKTEYA